MSVDVGAVDRQHYIVFCDSKLRLLKRFKPGFQHCAIVRSEFGKIWTVIQDGYNALSIETYLIQDYPDPCMLFDGKTTIIPVDIVSDDRYRGHLCLFNCVEVCKAVLGIKKPFVLTPYQLYRYCYEQHAKPRKGRKEDAEATSCRDSTTETTAGA